MKEQVFIFIYSKDSKIQALGLNDATKLNDSLLSEGWIHTTTLDAATWIQYLHNFCEDIDLFDEVSSLSKLS